MSMSASVKITTLTGLLVAVGGFVMAVQAGEQLPAPPAATAPAAPGMTIHVDPNTGAIVKEPAPGTVPLPLTPQLRNALSTSHQGLVEEMSPVPGGGVKLDLQGRFQNPLMVTIDGEGKVRMQHLQQK
jgi:hypothetical protein